MHALIKPKAIERVRYDNFIGDLDRWSKAIFDGLILRVHGHPGLEQFQRDVIKPATSANDYRLFRDNEPSLYRTQVLQRTLFEHWPQKNAMVDSVLRLRRTVGGGAFVGPHIDLFESLPASAINLWVSFTPLERGETINFFPPRWHPGLGVNNSGGFKLGVFYESEGRLAPSKALSADALTSEIDAGEFFAFASGLMVHSSPFHVKKQRITADMRVLHVSDPCDLFFAEHRSFYCLDHLNEFNGSFEPKAILAELWNKYLQTDLFRFAGTIEKMLAEVSSHHQTVCDEQDPQFLLLTLKAHEQPIPLSMLDYMLDRHPASVSLRVLIARDFPGTPAARRAAIELLGMPAENNLKALTVAAKGLDIGTFMKEVKERSEMSRPYSAACFLALHAPTNFTLAPARAAVSRLQSKASRCLNKRLFPEIYFNAA